MAASVNHVVHHDVTEDIFFFFIDLFEKLHKVNMLFNTVLKPKWISIE